MKKYASHAIPNTILLRELITRNELLYGDDIAYSYRRRPSDPEAVRVSFREFASDVRALAGELLRRGLSGRHCAIIGKLSYGWILTYQAILAGGGVAIPLDPEWAAEDLRETTRTAEASLFLCDADAAAKLDLSPETELLLLGEGGKQESVFDLVRIGRERLAENEALLNDAPIDPDAMALLVFTSGTTGKGKGVMLSARAIITDIYNIIPHVDLSRKSVALLPPHHTFGGNTCLLGNFTIGVETYLSSGIRYVLKELKSEKPGHLILVPLYLETFYRKILAGIRDQEKEESFAFARKTSRLLRRARIDMRRTLFSSVLSAFGGELHTVVVGGAPLSREIIDFFDSIGVSILNGYGITECAPVVSFNHSRRNIFGSVGFPIADNEVKIAEPNENGEGEIRVRGKNVMLGYFKDPDATAAAFDGEGFFRTGDIGRLDRERALYITGRLKNLIILSNGKNVYPEEIESVFTAIPGVLECVVYEGESRRGVMHNAIVCEIYPDRDFFEKAGIESIEEHLNFHIEDYNRNAVPYKKIGLLRIREEEFPKNTLRKILRFRIDTAID